MNQYKKNSHHEYSHDKDNYYLSNFAVENCELDEISESGMNAKMARHIIKDEGALDFQPTLNTSSYVNVNFEEEEQDVLLMGSKINLADQTVYPHAFKIHDKVVNMIARLWHCPEPKDFKEKGVFAGAGTVGSTEACLLAGLALKFRWRKWYAKKHDLSENEVLAIRPNLIISTCFQAAWEKLFRYMDIEPRMIVPDSKTFTMNPKDIKNHVDDQTIGVVGILGNHWGGQYDPIWDMNKEIELINKKKGFQLGIHVDAASGGFIAPFQKLPAWDFRLKNVLSISSSGHKYGESCAGTGWIIWRQRKDLSEHVAISVTYLGGKSDSYTLNFSRPASGPFVQYYKFLRFGKSGYQACCDNMMTNADFLRKAMKKMRYKGKPRFVFLDAGNKGCLPVVTAQLNPACRFTYNDIDLQHVLSQHHWYVSGYRMNFNHPITEEQCPLFSDQEPEQTMFRVVVKSNVTRTLINDLIKAFDHSFEFLDSVDFTGSLDSTHFRHKNSRVITNHC